MIPDLNRLILRQFSLLLVLNLRVDVGEYTSHISGGRGGRCGGVGDSWASLGDGRYIGGSWRGFESLLTRS